MTLSEFPVHFLLWFAVGYVLSPLIILILRIIWDVAFKPPIDVVKGWLEERANAAGRAETAAWLSKFGPLPDNWEVGEDGTISRRVETPDGDRKVSLFLTEDGRAGEWRTTYTIHREGSSWGLGAWPRIADYKPFKETIAEADWWLEHKETQS